MTIPNKIEFFFRSSQLVQPSLLEDIDDLRRRRIAYGLIQILVGFKHILYLFEIVLVRLGLIPEIVHHFRKVVPREISRVNFECGIAQADKTVDCFK